MVVDKARIEAQDRARFFQAVEGFQRPAESKTSALARVVPMQRLPAMHARARKTLDERAELALQGRRARGAEQQAKALAPPVAKGGERIREVALELAARGGLAALAWRFGALGIPELQNA